MNALSKGVVIMSVTIHQEVIIVLVTMDLCWTTTTALVQVKPCSSVWDKKNYSYGRVMNIDIKALWREQSVFLNVA